MVQLLPCAGLLLSLIFASYLALDSAIAFLWRAHFRRAMGALYLHHLFVGIGVISYLWPSPPRGFFVYVWGEVGFMPQCQRELNYSCLRLLAGAYCLPRTTTLSLIHI